MNSASKIAIVIRRTLEKEVAQHKGRRIAVALSGGVDSCSILAACLSQGIKPTVISYTPNTHDSTDFKMARDTAKRLNLNFRSAIVNMHPQSLQKTARRILEMGYTTKVQVESLSPMWIISGVAQLIGIEVLLTGDQADGYFCLSRFGAMEGARTLGVPLKDRPHTLRGSTDVALFNHIRKSYYDKDKSCSGAVAALCRERNVVADFPFRAEAIRKAFIGSLWDEINKPRIKEPIKLAFEDWFGPDKIAVRPTNVNLHKGDSNFGNDFARILMETIPGNWKSPIALYHAMARGEA